MDSSMDIGITDDSGLPEEVVPPTTTIVFEFTAILVTSSGCTLLDEAVAEAWVNWYAGAIVGFTSESSPNTPGVCLQMAVRAWYEDCNAHDDCSLMPVGYPLQMRELAIEAPGHEIFHNNVAVYVTTSNIMAPGDQGACDVPISSTTRIALPAFVLGSDAETDIIAFLGKMETSISSILTAAAKFVSFVNCHPAFSNFALCV